MPHLDVQGASLYYETRGEGHPMILIPGFGRDHTSWSPLMEILAKQFSLILVDNRGCGRTKDQGSPLSAELLCDDVKRVIDHLGLEQPHIIGQSMGGAIAQMLALRHPQAIGKLILLVTAAHWRPEVLDQLHKLILLRQQGIPAQQIVELALPLLFGPAFLAHPARKNKIIQILSCELDLQSLDDQLRQMELLKQFDTRSCLHQILAPTLIGYGTEDPLASVCDAQEIASRIPGAQLISFPTGHSAVLEAPQMLATQIQNFCKRTYQ